MNTYEELREKIQQSVGEVSMCWKNPDGVFDTEEAINIADNLYEYVVEFVKNAELVARLKASGLLRCGGIKE